MCYTDLEMPEFFREIIVKARKDHTCCECRDPIKKGDIYQSNSGKWAYGFEEYKICARCYFARELLARDEIKEGCGHHEAYPAFTQLAEAWHEAHRGFSYKDPPADCPELTDVHRW